MKPTSRRPLPVEVQFVVKTYDIDFLGHVSNIVYIRWLEDMRLHFLDTYYPLQKQVERGFAPVLTRTNIQYRRAIKLFEPVTGRMWVESMGAARVYIGADFLVGDELCANVLQEAVFADLETGRPMRVPQDLRRMVDAWEES
jgi:acyl-CoA thioester hydrolase